MFLWRPKCVQQAATYSMTCTTFVISDACPTKEGHIHGKSRHAAQAGRIGGGCLYFRLYCRSSFRLRTEITWRLA